MHDLYDSLDHAGVLHVASLASVAGALTGWLPPLATGLACVYYMIKIYESVTGQRFSAWLRSKLSK